MFQALFLRSGGQPPSIDFKDATKAYIRSPSVGSSDFDNVLEFYFYIDGGLRPTHEVRSTWSVACKAGSPEGKQSILFTLRGEIDYACMAADTLGSVSLQCCMRKKSHASQYCNMGNTSTNAPIPTLSVTSYLIVPPPT